MRSETSMRRNSRRLLCSVCNLPILGHAKIKRCAFCDGPTRKRVLDDPKIIIVRLKEYKERTYPIVARARKLGITVKHIDGEPKPYVVHKKVLRVLKL